MSNIIPQLNPLGILQKNNSPVGVLSYGNRVDGQGLKGNGYFGPLKRPDGNISTELSFDFNHPNYGKVYAPLLVPTLTRQEIDHLLNLKDGEKPINSIYDKAEEFAIQRLNDKKPTWALPDEIYNVPEMDN